MSVKAQLVTDLKTFDIEYTTTLKAGEGWGSDKFLTHAQCADAYKDRDFVVTAKLETDGEVVKIVGNRDSAASAPKKRNFNVWENVNNKMDSSDFTLVFGGEEVPCHKHILAAASPVIEAMVKNKHREAIQSKANMKLSAEVGRAFVRFIYTGEVQEDVLQANAPAFLEMGEMYNLQELKDLAEKELLSQLEKKNMVEMVYMGELFRAEDIFEAALKMTKVNMTWLRNQVFSKFYRKSPSDKPPFSGWKHGGGEEAEQRHLDQASLVLLTFGIKVFGLIQCKTCLFDLSIYDAGNTSKTSLPFF